MLVSNFEWIGSDGSPPPFRLQRAFIILLVGWRTRVLECAAKSESPADYSSTGLKLDVGGGQETLGCLPLDFTK